MVCQFLDICVISHRRSQSRLARWSLSTAEGLQGQGSLDLTERERHHLGEPTEDLMTGNASEPNDPMTVMLFVSFSITSLLQHHAFDDVGSRVSQADGNGEDTPSVSE